MGFQLYIIHAMAWRGRIMKGYLVTAIKHYLYSLEGIVIQVILPIPPRKTTHKSKSIITRL